MNRYVVGFAFTPDRQFLLVSKLRPKWQKGCLNGIGGKIEEGESPKDAMAREAEEEAGLGKLLWVLRGKMEGTNNDGVPFECFIFAAESILVRSFKQIEDEPLGLYSLQEALSQRHITNLEYLLPFVSVVDFGMPLALIRYNPQDGDKLFT